MQESILYDRRLHGISFAILFIGIALFAATGSYVFLLPSALLLFGIVLIFDWKLAYWLLIASIPFAIEYALMDDGSLSTTIPDEPMMWLFVLIFAVMYIRKPTILPEWFWRNRLVLIMVLQYLWTIVAVIYSKETTISIKFLAAKTWFLVSFIVIPCIIFRDRKDFKKAFLYFFFPLLTTMIIIMYRHSTRDFLFYKINRAIGALYYNHVDYSTVISMFFPALCIAYHLSKGKKKWLRITLFILILFFLAAIYFTYARAAMIAVLFAGFMGFALKKKIIRLVMPGFYVVMLSLLAYVISDGHYIKYRPSFENTYMRKDFVDHMVATFKGQDMSSMERVYRWIAGIRMSKFEPITGYGPNSFYFYYKPYALNMFHTYVSRNYERSTAHNYYLYMLVEQGWPAMILYAILIVAFYAQAQKIYNRFRSKDHFYANVTMAVTMMFSAGFINNFFSDLIETHKVGGLFYLCIAMMIVLERKSRVFQDQGFVPEGIELDA
jgi:O-antigen ligase